MKIAHERQSAYRTGKTQKVQIASIFLCLGVTPFRRLNGSKAMLSSICFDAMRFADMTSDSAPMCKPA